MAPEQVKHSLINERTDVYNFGGLMYRLVSWKLPPSVVSEEDGGIPLDAKMWERTYKPVEEVNPRTPAKLAELINACLQFDAHRRPERMSEIQGTLDRLCDELVTPDDRLDAIDW
jgi:serine/threonine protein kinase